MRVAFDARYLNNPSSGIGTYCDNLLRALLRESSELQFLLITKQHGLSSDYDSERCQDLVFRAPPRSFATVYGLAPRLRSQQFDLFHSPFNIIPSGLRRPSVVTIHDVMQLQNPANIATSRFVQQTAGLFWRTRIRHAARHASHVAAVSAATQDAVLEHVPELDRERVTVTPNGVDDYFFEPPTATELEEAKQLTHGAPYVLCVGNESPHKNHKRAVRAFLEAYPAESGMRFVLVRRSVRHDPQMVALLEQADAQRRVIVLERTSLPVLRALYHTARVFFFPSWVEGFGIPILESMACQTPVVTSDRNAPKEVAGDAAVLCNPFDITEMAGALQRATEDTALRSELVQRGQVRAREFTWQRCGRATLSAYRKALQAEAAR